MKQTQLLKSLMSNLQNGSDGKDFSRISIKISKELNISNEDKKLIKNFCDLCSDMLEMKGDYECFLAADRKKAKIVTTAICSFSENSIKIYCHDRALADILRSIAHEMFHLRQHELDLIPKEMNKPHHLNPVEWHANAASGSFLSYFAQKVGKDKIYR